MENHIYNLMKAITKKSQAIWKYPNYKHDSASCPKCQDLWKVIHAEDQEHLTALKAHLLEHFKGQ